MGESEGEARTAKETNDVGSGSEEDRSSATCSMGQRKGGQVPVLPDRRPRLYTFPSGTTNPLALAYDGANIWVTGFNGPLVELTASSGAIEGTFNSEGDYFFDSVDAATVTLSPKASHAR